MKNAKKFLKEIIKDYNRTKLEKNVAKIILDYSDSDDDIVATIKDVMNNGVLGILSEFTYTKDIYEFFKNNIYDIVEFIAKIEYETGEKIDTYRDINTDIIVFLTCYVVEYIINNFSIELNI